MEKVALADILTQLTEIKNCRTRDELDTFVRKNIQLYFDSDIVKELVYRRYINLIDDDPGGFVNPPDLKEGRDI